MSVLALTVSSLQGCAIASESSDSAASADIQTRSQALTPYKSATKPTQTMQATGALKDLIIVKFAEGSRVRLQAGALAMDTVRMSGDDAKRLNRTGLSVGAASAELATLRATITAAASGPMRSLFTRAEVELAADKAVGESARGRELADLKLLYEIPVREERALELLEALNRSQLVELAYPAPMPVKPPAMDLAPTTPSYVANQGYLNPAPRGIDAKYAWTRPGGTGANVRIIDIEYGWHTMHEDLGAGGTNGPAVSLRGNGLCGPLDGIWHGTAVLGELVAANNAFGVTGISYGASYGTSGAFATASPCAGYSVANAINAAVGGTAAGDVILIELQTEGPVSCPQSVAPPCGWTAAPTATSPAGCGEQYGLVPMEWNLAEFLAIEAATAMGRVVVEAAGNGEQDLDAPIYQDRFNPFSRDSGAIIVGAGSATTRQPLCFTNFGSRVDVQGWGESVRTLSYGTIRVNGSDQMQWYTSSFGGTSSASPIVAGAAANIQAMRKAAGQAVAPSQEMRFLLMFTGTPQPTPVTHHIGPLPNLRAFTEHEPPADGHLVAAQLTSSVSSVFAAGPHSVYRRTKTGTGPWQLDDIPGTAFLFPPGAPLATGMQGTSQLDLFGVDFAGTLWYATSSSGGAFGYMNEISAPNAAPVRANLATGVRGGNQLNVFFVNSAGSLATYTVTGTSSTWTGPTVVATNFAPPGAALATARHGANQLDVFAIGNDGALKVAWAIDSLGWAGPINLSLPNAATPGSGVATGRQGTNQLDAFFVGTNGIVSAAWVVGQGMWTGALPLHSGAIASSTARISAVNHGSGDNTLDVFVTGSDASVKRLRVVGTGSWSAPVTVANESGRTITSLSPSVAKRGTSDVHLFAIASNGLSVSTATSGGSFSTFSKLPPL